MHAVQAAASQSGRGAEIRDSVRRPAERPELPRPTLPWPPPKISSRRLIKRELRGTRRFSAQGELPKSCPRPRAAQSCPKNGARTAWRPLARLRQGPRSTPPGRPAESRRKPPRPGADGGQSSAAAGARTARGALSYPLASTCRAASLLQLTVETHTTWYQRQLTELGIVIGCGPRTPNT